MIHDIAEHISAFRKPKWKITTVYHNSLYLKDIYANETFRQLPTQQFEYS